MCTLYAVPFSNGEVILQHEKVILLFILIWENLNDGAKIFIFQSMHFHPNLIGKVPCANSSIQGVSFFCFLGGGIYSSLFIFTLILQKNSFIQLNLSKSKSRKQISCTKRLIYFT